MQSGIPRSSRPSSGGKPSPRFASVVGQRQTPAPCSASRSSSRASACVAWTIVVRGPRQPGLGEELDRPEAVLGEALLDLARLLVGVDVEDEALALGVGADLLEPLARAGADGVGGEPDPRPGRASASTWRR